MAYKIKRVPATGLYKEYVDLWVFGEARSHSGTTGTRANDNIVILLAGGDLGRAGKESGLYRGGARQKGEQVEAGKV